MFGRALYEATRLQSLNKFISFSIFRFTFHSNVVPAGAAVCVFIGVIVVSRVTNGFVDASTRGVIRLPTRTPCDVSCVRSRCRCARVVVAGMTRRCDCSRRNCCSILNFVRSACLEICIC